MKKNGETQEQRVLNYMQNVGAISSLDAIRELGILRLGARIFTLRKRGYNILGRTRTATNRFGDKVHYTEYFLESEQK